jgi:hypothetical protein
LDTVDYAVMAKADLTDLTANKVVKNGLKTNNLS